MTPPTHPQHPTFPGQAGQGALPDVGGDSLDVVRLLLERVADRIPTADRAQLVAIEAEFRAEFGLRRARISTRATYRQALERAAALSQADTAAAATNADLIRSSGLPRSSWYRLVKSRRV